MAAQQSRCFADIIVSTDTMKAAAVAHAYGIRSIRINEVGHQDDDADDIWIKAVLKQFPPEPLQTYALLRPTSPFRTAATINRALTQFSRPDSTADSLRAVRLCTEHPAKMWRQTGEGYPMFPVLPGRHPDGTPYHSSPTQSLPPVYVQTSSLEMFWAANLERYGSFAGAKIDPFITDNIEGLSIDTEDDWTHAERLVAEGMATLPPCGSPPDPILATS